MVRDIGKVKARKPGYIRLLECRIRQENGSISWHSRYCFIGNMTDIGENNCVNIPSYLFINLYISPSNSDTMQVLFPVCQCGKGNGEK
jgi:hypothetical protein